MTDNTYTCDACGGANLHRQYYVWQNVRTDEFDTAGAEVTDWGDGDWYCDDCGDCVSVTAHPMPVEIAMPGRGGYQLLKCANSFDHHIWRERRTGALVISDHSADDTRGLPDDPRNTDDGVLYINWALRPRYERGRLWLPLLRDTGLPTWTSTSKEEVARIEHYGSRQFGTVADPQRQVPQASPASSEAPAASEAVETVRFEKAADGRTRILLVSSRPGCVPTYRHGGWLMPALGYAPYWRIEG